MAAALKAEFSRNSANAAIALEQFCAHPVQPDGALQLGGCEPEMLLAALEQRRPGDLQFLAEGFAAHQILGFGNAAVQHLESGLVPFLPWPDEVGLRSWSLKCREGDFEKVVSEFFWLRIFFVAAEAFH